MLNMSITNNDTPDKILIIAPAWIGDMIIAQSLYALLKQQKTNSQIDILAPNSSLALASRMPQITNLFEQPLGHGQLGLATRYKLSKRLRQQQYTQAIVLPNSFKSALIPCWAKIHKRTGWLGEQRQLLLNDVRRLNKEKYPALVQRYAALALPKRAPLPNSLADPQLQTSAENIQACLNKFNITEDKRPILALCPGAAYGSAKRWPTEHFAAVAQHFLAKDWQVWLFLARSEEEIATQIQTLTAQRCVNLAGKTNLLDAIDLLSLADLSITNDSGLMHIAAAVNVPIVALYGSTSPIYTPPLTNKARILQLNYDCIPCFQRECPLTDKEYLRCLKNLTPTMAISAATELLK